MGQIINLMINARVRDKLFIDFVDKKNIQLDCFGL